MERAALLTRAHSYVFWKKMLRAELKVQTNAEGHPTVMSSGRKCCEKMVRS